jgi:hypothetical protein
MLGNRWRIIALILAALLAAALACSQLRNDQPLVIHRIASAAMWTSTIGPMAAEAHAMMETCQRAGTDLSTLVTALCQVWFTRGRLILLLTVAMVLAECLRGWRETREAAQGWGTASAAARKSRIRRMGVWVPRAAFCVLALVPALYHGTMWTLAT